MADIKPCPFCGASIDSMDTAAGSFGNGDGFMQVVCSNCDASGPSIKSPIQPGDQSKAAEEKAFQAWNRRAR